MLPTAKAVTGVGLRYNSMCTIRLSLLRKVTEWFQGGRDPHLSVFKCEVKACKRYIRRPRGSEVEYNCTESSKSGVGRIFLLVYCPCLIADYTCRKTDGHIEFLREGARTVASS